MKIVTPSEMKAMDERTVEEGLFTSLRLMQNAAEALYRTLVPWIEAHGADRVLLLAGPGNNGGDAYALACMLHPVYRPALLAVGGDHRSPDCEYYYNKCKELQIPFVTHPEGFPLVIEGVFGTGFRGELPKEVQAVFDAVKVPVASIDLPGGMNGGNGVAAAGTLKPEVTVTFAFQKPCHLFADCGRVVLEDIGIPASYADAIRCKELTPVLPARSAWGHKNSYGSVGLRVGSADYPGAAALALLGALRSGAGLVFGYLPEDARRAAAAKFYGPVLQRESELFPLTCDSYVVGSGLGRSAESAREVAELWNTDRPLVVDGDGLWHLREGLSFRSAVTVLTPHLGEFSYLTGCSVEAIRADRLAVAEAFAREHGVILVLKDAATVVTDGNRTEILSRPCSALGKGGSGDLLAGLIGGMLAGEGDPFDLVKTAVYLHNRAAHLAVAEHSARALQPQDIATYLDNAWMELEHGLF